MRARKHGGFAVERAQIVETTAVAAVLLVEDADAEGFLLEVVEGLADFEAWWRQGKRP
jgi:hypothetical protein